MYSILHKLECIENKLDQPLYRKILSKVKKPVLAMTFGPTGAGKSKMGRQVMDKYNETEFVQILIDDLVENDYKYKESVKKIIQKYKLNHNETAQSLLSDPPIELFDAFSQAYANVRFKTGCRTNKRDEEEWNCNQENDEILGRALENKQNIVFEMTGTYSPTWLYDMSRPHNYLIVASYSLVTFCSLIQRNKSRAINDLKYFLEDTQKHSAPRLPNVLDGEEKQKQIYRKLMEDIKKVLDELLQNCLECNTNTMDCKCPVDEILLFDNNGAELKEAFHYSKYANDGVKKEQVMDILAVLMRIPKGRCTF